MQSADTIMQPVHDHDENEAIYIPADSVESESNVSVVEVASPPEQTYDTASCLRRKCFILEPAVFLVFFSRYLIFNVLQNQVLYQTCIAVYNHSESECEPLLGTDRESENAKQIETEVQPYVTQILMWASLLESIIPAFLSMFIGPWSDKFGRRPILLVTFVGYLASSIILMAISYINTSTTISPWWFLLSSVPNVLSGGICALITGIYCYISDVASQRYKAVRMVLNEASISSGVMIGTIASGYLYVATNALVVFSVSASLMILALIYLVAFVPESLEQNQIGSGHRLREFFRFDLVKTLVRTCFQRRPDYNRAIIWLTMVALTIALFSQQGESNVDYLFVRERFNWTIKDYSWFNAARVVVQLIGNFVGIVVLQRIFGCSIIIMSMLAYGSCVLEAVVRATAAVWWEMYVGMSLGIMRGNMGPMCRAILSLVTPSHEVGKVYALTTAMETVSPLISAPLYVGVYDRTLAFYPGAYNFLSTGFYFMCFLCIVSIYSIQQMYGNTVTYKAIGGSS